MSETNAAAHATGRTSSDDIRHEPPHETPHETQTHRALERRNRELSILNAIAAELNRSVDLDATLRTALALVSELLGLRTGWVWLLHEETGIPYLAAAQNLPPALADHPRRMEGTCYCLDTFQAGDLEGAANVNVVTCSRLKGLLEGSDGLRYHASIPLYAQRKQLGILNVVSPDWRELSADDLRLLHTVGDLLGIAIERTRLFARSAEIGAVEERNRLAREIHDTLAQGMTAVALQLEAADALAESGADPDRIADAVKRALALTRANLAEVRRSVLDLRAAPLEGRTLAEAVTALAQPGGDAQPAISVEVTGARRPLPLRVEVGVYRVLQEALANAQRHAHAKTITMRLALQPDRVTCIVADDGRGFDTGRVRRGHFGLIGMRERARLLGGSLTVESARGRGTRLLLDVPLDLPGEGGR